MNARRRPARGTRARRLTHLDAAGRARMVDVADKPVTARRAEAAGSISMNAEAYAAVRCGGLAKGDVRPVAQIAGIAAAKRTADLIPLCHPLPLDQVNVELEFRDRERAIRAVAQVRTRWSTGVEMEALVAVTMALLTVYDMAKSLDRGMILGPVRLIRKSGGKSGDYLWRPGRRG